MPTVQMRWSEEVVRGVDERARLVGLSRTAFVLRELGYGAALPVDRKATVESLQAEIDVREGRIDPKDCLHPRDRRNVLPYMTKCDACGGRLS